MYICNKPLQHLMCNYSPTPIKLHVYKPHELCKSTFVTLYGTWCINCMQAQPHTSLINCGHIFSFPQTHRYTYIVFLLKYFNIICSHLFQDIPSGHQQSMSVHSVGVTFQPLHVRCLHLASLEWSV